MALYHRPWSRYWQYKLWRIVIKSFSDYNPIAIFVYYFSVLIPVMFCSNPYISIAGFISGILYLIVKNGFKALKRSAWMLAVPFLTAIINPIFNHNGMTVLFVLNNNPVSLESVVYGLFSGMMIAAVLLWFASFTEIMTSDKLLYVFGSISPKLALILSMTLRYIPLFKQQVVKTNNAQKAMGLYKDDTAFDKIRGGMRIFSVMVSWALENGVITADSMTARGYGTGKRSRFAIFKWAKQDIILLCVSIFLCMPSVISLIMGKTNVIWFPSISMPDNTAFTLITYISFAILCILPDYLQIKEETRWKSLQSKI